MAMFIILQENVSYPFTFPKSADTCRVPALDYSALTVPGVPGVSIIYATPSSSCSGRVVGYSFCYQNSNTNSDNVRIATALVLQETGQNFRIIQNFEVEAQPREDNCLPESRSDLMQCCVYRTLDDPFAEVDLQLYGLVIPEVRNGPRMIQTQGSPGRGYQFNSMLYTEPQNSILMRQTLGIGARSAVPLKMFQFRIGKFRNQFL